MEDITLMCSPPDPKTQPKITTFLRQSAENTPDLDRSTNQTRITSFFQKSPCSKAGRKRPTSVREPDKVTDLTGAVGETNTGCLSLSTTSEEDIICTSKCVAAEDNDVPQPKRKSLFETPESIREVLDTPSNKKMKGENETIEKRPVGRPRKILPVGNVTESTSANCVVAAKRPVGRPRKTKPPAEGNAQVDDVRQVSSQQETASLGSQGPKKKRPVGRPRKPLTPKVKTPTTKPTGKQSRTCYSIEKKQEVVEFARQHSIYKASIHYNLSCGTIGPWMKKDFSTMKARNRRSSGGGRKLSYPPEIEAELTEWILVQRDKQPNLSNQDIATHACTLIQPACPSFRGTSGWLHKFMVRNNLLFTYDAPLEYTLPAPLEEKISTFLESVRGDRSEYDYPNELVGNMDEVSVTIDMASNRKAEKSKTMTFPTYTIGGEKKSYTVGTEKQHISVILTALANGDLLPPMVVFRGSKAPKNIRIPDNWIVCSQESARFDSDLMNIWIRDIWLKYTQGRKALLILDTHHPHCSEDYQSLLADGCTTVQCIPHGCSSKLEPVPLFLSTPFRAICRNLTSCFYSSQLRSLSSPGEKLQSATRQNICYWLHKAFEEITTMSAMIVRSFKVTGLTLALDGSENNLLRRDEEVLNNDESKESAAEHLDLSVVEDKANDIEGIREEFGALDGSIETLYNYMLEIQSKAIPEADLQSNDK